MLLVDYYGRALPVEDRAVPRKLLSLSTTSKCAAFARSNGAASDEPDPPRPLPAHCCTAAEWPNPTLQS